jgi:membrane-bound lytic murein transglycosylase
MKINLKDAKSSRYGYAGRRGRRFRQKFPVLLGEGKIDENKFERCEIV